MGGSSETTTNKTAPLSAEGQEWNSIFHDIIMQQMDEAGFDMVPNETTTYNDPKKVESLNLEVNKWNAKISDIDLKIAKLPNDNSPMTVRQREALMSQKSQLQYSLQTANYNLNKEKANSVTYTKWDMKKRDDIRVTDAIAKYGADSPEAKAIQAQVKQEEVDKQSSLKGIESSYLTNMKKFVSGDYSYTPEQALQAEKYTAPLKDIIVKSADELMAMAGDNAEKLKMGLNELSNEIDRTGFAVGDALRAAQVQIEKSGVTMMDALRTANASSLNRAKFEFDLLSQDIDKKAAQTSAMLGLPPGSMAEQIQKTKLKTDALRMLENQANERELQGELGVTQMTEEEKKQISLAQVSLAASQGEKKEGVATSRLGIDENLGNTKLSIASSRANSLLGIEGQKHQMLAGMGYGNIPQLLGAAQGGLSFASQQKNNDLAFGQQLMSPIFNARQTEEQRSMAENTSTTKKNPGFLSTFSDIIGLGTGVASTAMGGFGIGNFGK